MKKMYDLINTALVCIVLVITTGSSYAEGGFAVTQYNLTQPPQSNSDAARMRSNSAYWNGAPIIASYKTIAFELGVLAESAKWRSYFSYPMSSFPEVKGECFSLEITGKIRIPRKGKWTFCMHHDDGFVCKISRDGKVFTFQNEGWLWGGGLKDF